METHTTTGRAAVPLTELIKLGTVADGQDVDLKLQAVMLLDRYRSAASAVIHARGLERQAEQELMKFAQEHLDGMVENHHEAIREIHGLLSEWAMGELRARNILTPAQQLRATQAEQQ